MEHHPSHPGEWNAWANLHACWVPLRIGTFNSLRFLPKPYAGGLRRAHSASYASINAKIFD
jgi:hypothetical protein